MKENRFIEKISSKTNEELNDIISNSHKYIPDVIEAALIELDKRGITVNDSKSIEKRINRQKTIYNDTGSGITYQQLESEAISLLHTKRTIYIIYAVLSVLIIVISVIFSSYSLINDWVLFGNILIVIGFCSIIFYKQIIRFQGPSKDYSIDRQKEWILTTGTGLLTVGIVALIKGIIN
jgi:hypothetical protein